VPVPELARRWRPLSERECYLRLYGQRSGLVDLLDDAERRLRREPLRTAADRPALHLVFPRGKSRLGMTGEDIRLDLARRMAARAEAEERAA
jgi:hypothetical protein